jgi:PAS domain S-box-containing protein
LWLLGVLVVTMVVVSALVLWHEAQVLEDELVSRADLLAHSLALAAAEGDSPEFLAVLSTTDLRAGVVRSENGQVLWQFGPSLSEVEALDAGVLRVERRVEIASGRWRGDDGIEVVLLVSRARLRSHLAMSAVRLLLGLGIALTLALVAGLALIGRIVQPLQDLAGWVREFDPERPVDPPLHRATTAEVRDLGAAFHDMARRLAEQRQSLVVSERRFRELFTASPSPLLRVAPDLSLREANPAAEAYLGRSESRSVGTSLSAYLERPQRAEVLQILGESTSDDEVVLEALWRLGSDEVAEVELRVVSAGDEPEAGYLVAVHDITDRVRRMGERWRRTFDAMVDGVALVDGAGRIVLANRALGVHADAVATGLGERLRAGDRRPWRVENVGRLLDCALSEPEGLEHAVLVVRDVTESVDAEERLRDAEKMRAVGTLASGVAHDFNNLLAAILLHVRLLERRPETHDDAAAAIAELAQQGTEVVRELLLFARRESGPPGTIDLVEMVRLQESVLRHLLTDDVSLGLELDEEPVPVVGDAVGLRRLLLNLVLNAGDAVADEGGTVTVRVERTAGRAVLEVADDGPGIPPEVREHLFEPFFTLRRRGRGAGLGLAVVYGIASAHGGEVDVRSSPGAGARFVVRFPVGDAADIESLEGAAGTATNETRVLLVERDGRAAAEVIERLADLGLEVRHAPAPAAVDEILERWSPTLVVVADGDPDGEMGPLIDDLQVPVVEFTGGEDGAAQRPGVIRLSPAATADDLVAALRDLHLLQDA